ncbi:MAG: hypothetical protein ACLT76_09395 [Clostridium fessum]
MVLTELAVFTKVTANAKHVVSTATAMTILGAAMLVFGEAVKKMGNSDWGEIGRGLYHDGRFSGGRDSCDESTSKGMVSKATGMVEVGAALLIIGEAVRNMGGMSWDEIARGLVTLAGSMTILVVALNAMRTALPGAAAVLTVSAALAIFTPVLKSLGNMSWESIAKGLVALARFFHGSRCRRSGIRAIDPSYFRTFSRHCCVGSRMSGRRCWHSRIFHWTFCFGSIWSGAEQHL